ncbi:glycosyltransferase [Pseudobutyrivibrio ruminis]|uniref:Dolichol-phosphate mannosyltransferase n=1 Tax=Pseudobutyrivibrio ruminis DSM 9787 TaxID=1123011 RepID=A0A285SAQ2_9FIRM|nr:glycosyltransferase [Pseudobutyrivibrio ruminis]SOC04166.1 dolichol-phosphate mannosyltransferase [Pseudobutyrivibrio ruminis DSM 9787]
MENKEKNFISAVIYVHNAANRIERFLTTVINELEANFEHSEIICVNDSSDDNSLDVIKKVSNQAKSTSISVVNMSYFHGLELSMNAGVDMSIGDFVFEFDNTNLDFDPSMIMRIYRHSLEGFDIVSASPNKRLKLTSRLFYNVFDKFANIKYEMSTESFRVLSRRVINRISSMNKTTLYRKAMYANCGLKTDTIKYDVVDKTTEAIDKRERNYRSGLAVDSLILFTEVGYRFSKVMTMAMIFITLFVVVYTVVAYFTLNPVEGWTTTILFLSVCFFGLFAIQTIIVKYLQLLIDMVFKRKNYSFESVEKLTK